MRTGTMVLVVCIILSFVLDTIANGMHIDSILSKSISDIESLDFCNHNAPTTLNLLQDANKVSDDELSGNKNKALIITAILADCTKEKIEQGLWDPSSGSVKEIVEQLATANYHVYFPRPSDFEKLAFYYCDGRYAYIFRRLNNHRLFPIGCVAAIVYAICMWILFHLQFVSIKRMLYTHLFGIIFFLLILFLIKVNC